MIALIMFFLLQAEITIHFDIINFMVENQKIDWFTYIIGEDSKHIEEQDPINRAKLLKDIKDCFRASNYYNTSVRAAVMLELFKEKYGDNISLSAIVIKDFYHDQLYSPTVFTIIKTNDNLNGLICYISGKDSFKYDSLNEMELNIISRFSAVSKNISVIASQDDRTNFYMKTIDFKTNEISEAYFVRVEKFSVSEIIENNSSEDSLHEIAKNYNKVFQLLLEKTSRMRCN